MDFDDVARGYEHARYMGRVVTGGVLQAYDKVKYIDVETLRYKQRMIQIPSLSNIQLPDFLYSFLVLFNIVKL